MKHKEKIIELLQLGKSHNYIVKELGCSKGTVSFHSKRMFGKRMNWSKRLEKSCLQCNKLFKPKITTRRFCSNKCRSQSQQIRPVVDKNLICSDCGRSYLYSPASSFTSIKCNSCNVNNRRVIKKEKAVEYKGGKCQLCGYNKCIQALDFHHIDPISKKFTISGNYMRPWEVLKEELDKCVLLCANCHREIEAGILAL